MIPPDVQRYIEQNIQSVVELEVLLVYRVDTAKEWDAEALSARLFVARQHAHAALGRLAGLGFLTPSQDPARHSAYRATADVTGPLVDLLMECYRLYLLPVTTLIHSRQHAAIQFANAFRFRAKESS